MTTIKIASIEGHYIDANIAQGDEPVERIAIGIASVCFRKATISPTRDHHINRTTLLYPKSWRQFALGFLRDEQPSVTS